MRGDGPAGAGGFVTGEKQAVHLPRLVETGIRHGRVFNEIFALGRSLRFRGTV
jgi:hypothetical protein